MARGFSIKIFLADGTPDGVKVVEKSNWIGRAVVCPRSRYAEAKIRDEFSKTGVYVLVGPSQDSTLPMIYVGEGDPVRPRLDQHFAKKDFWTHAIVFVSKDENMNKAHVQFLESRLVEVASELKRSQLDNGNLPARPSLSEADQAELETFLEEMLVMYPVLGLSSFDRPSSEQQTKTVSLQIHSKGIQARGYESPSGFVVVRDSEVVPSTVPSIHRYLIELREDLRQKGIIADGPNGSWRFTQDYQFDSPSTAAGVVLGRSANGRTEWQDQSGRTLRSIQESQAQ